MDLSVIKDLGLSGEYVFILAFIMLLLQVTKYILDYVAKMKKDGGASHDDIMQLCLRILEKLEHK